MLIKETTNMTTSERVAVSNTNNLYLRMLCVLPMGVILHFVGKTTPIGYMACDGTELVKEEYPDLFNAIGYSYGGSGDSFCLPNFEEHIIKVSDTDINSGFQYVDSALSDSSKKIISYVDVKTNEISDSVEAQKLSLENHTSYAHQMFTNALKGQAVGSEVNLSDVSPLSHTVSVKVSGVESTGETLTKTETVSSQGAAVTLDTPATSVRAVISGGAYCIAGIIPTVDGDDLTALSDFSALEIVPHGSYAEIGAIYDIVYTVEGNVLSWTGSWTYSDTETWGDEATEVSGSYTLSSSDQQITGFYQVYALDETNPHYVESDTEYMELNAEISLYEGKAVVVTVQGKNYFDVSKVVSSSAVTNDGNGTLTVTVGSTGGVKAGKPYTLRDYAPDLKVGETYTLSAVSPLPEGMTSSYASNYIWLSGYNDSWMFGSYKEKITETMLDSQVFWYVWGKKNATTTVSNIQIEKGSTATEYEPYKQPVTYKANADGTVEGVESIYPSMVLTTDTEGAELEVEYNRDINKAFAELQAAIVSMGGNV